MGNGCGAENGFEFVNLKNRIAKLPFVDKKLLNSCYHTIEIKGCLPHDDRAEEGGGIIAFIKSNYIFAKDLISILHWTTITGRAITFLLAFVGTSIGGIRTFNWTKVF